MSALSQKCVDLGNTSYKATNAVPDPSDPTYPALLKAAQDAAQALADCLAQLCKQQPCYGYAVPPAPAPPPSPKPQPGAGTPKK